MKQKRNFRQDRVAEQIQRVIAELLQFDAKDPRVSLVTVVDVEITKDLAYAKVYYTLLDESAVEDAKIGLEKSAGYIRKQLSQRMQLRHTPELRFIYDDSTIKGLQMSKLIDEAVEKDQSRVDKSSTEG
tara:strand:- start:28913 stop:29299 length:387 start_codon:yes stop_codon:yes gene_type:complete